MTKKPKSIVKRIIIMLLILCAFSIFFLLWYFFCPKKYSVYGVGTDTLNPKYIVVKLYGMELQEPYYKEYIIENDNSIENIKSSLNELSLKPCFDREDNGKKEEQECWKVQLYEDENTYLGIHDLGVMADGRELVNIGTAYNGLDMNNIFSFIGENVLEGQGGNEVREAVLQAINDEITDITKETLLQLCENKDKDFRHFQKYYYWDEEELTDTLSIDNDINNIVRFQIDSSDLYMLVWYQDEIHQYGTKKTDVEKIMKVYKAEIYNTKGESVGLYDKDLKNFLEDNG